MDPSKSDASAGEGRFKRDGETAGAEATATFQRLQAAYALLADPTTRAKYDRRRGSAGRTPRAAPSAMLRRVSGGLQGLLVCGIARPAEAGVIELTLTSEKAAQGGMKRTLDDLYAAWLAVPPEAFDRELLIPSAMLPGMVQPLSFRIRIAGTPK